MDGDGEPEGLRARKKAKTRAVIQECALRLFREQGYDATTIEQIAEAAEVSPSTFFRYFPTKEDTVLRDDYDPVLLAAFAAQPPSLSPARALRAAFRAVFAAAGPQDVAERIRLMREVPALQAGFLGHLAGTLHTLEAAVAERAGRDPRDVGVRAFCGAVLGVAMAAYFSWAEDEGGDVGATLDAAMAQLEAGLPL